MAVYSYNKTLFDGNNALDESIDLISESYFDSNYMLESLIDYEIDEMFIENGVYVTEDGDEKAGEEKKAENSDNKKKGILARIQEFFKKILDFFRSFGKKVEEKAQEINIADKALYEKYHVQVEKNANKVFRWKHKYININKYEDFVDILEDIDKDNTSKKNDVSKRTHCWFVSLFTGDDSYGGACKDILKEKSGTKDKYTDIVNKFYSHYGMIQGEGSGKDDENADINLLAEGDEEKEMKLNKSMILGLNSIMSDGQGKKLREIKSKINDIDKKISDTEKETLSGMDSKDSVQLAQMQAIQKMTTRTHTYLSRAISEATKLCSQVYTLRRKLYIAIGRANLEDAGDTTGEDDNWDESKGSTEKKSDIKEKQKKDKNAKNESALYEGDEDLEDVAADDIEDTDDMEDISADDIDVEESTLDLAFGI